MERADSELRDPDSRNKKGQLSAGLFCSFSGSTTWTRTRDPVINSHLLYQLSYRGMRRMLLIKKDKSSVDCSNGTFLAER